MIFSWIFSNNDLMKKMMLYCFATAGPVQFHLPGSRCTCCNFLKPIVVVGMPKWRLLPNPCCKINDVPTVFFWTVTPTISFSFWDKLKHFGDRSASLNLWCWIFECFFPAAADDIGNLISTWVRLKICPAKDTSTAFLSKRTESWKTPLIGG